MDNGIPCQSLLFTCGLDWGGSYPAIAVFIGSHITCADAWWPLWNGGGGGGFGGMLGSGGGLNYICIACGHRSKAEHAHAAEANAQGRLLTQTLKSCARRRFSKYNNVWIVVQRGEWMDCTYWCLSILYRTPKLKGYQDGTFRPLHQGVRRVRMSGVRTSSFLDYLFKDIPADAAANRQLTEAKR